MERKIQQARKDLEMIKVKLAKGGDYTALAQEAQAPLEIINARAKEIAKEHGMRFKPLTFSYITR